MSDEAQTKSTDLGEFARSIRQAIRNEKLTASEIADAIRTGTFTISELGDMQTALTEKIREKVN